MRVVIAGGGSVGRFIGQQLSEAKHEVLIIDNDPAVVRAAERSGEPAGVPWLQADACEATRLSEAQVDKADVVAAVTGDDEDPSGGEVVLPLTGELDLHAFAPRDIPSVVEEYVRACRERGVLELRLVHGRGRGVQRAVVRRRLASLPGVVGYDDAPPAAGGWGATIVRLAPADRS